MRLANCNLGLKTKASRGIFALPLHRLRTLTVPADVSHQFASQVRDGRERAANEGIALDLSEPRLDPNSAKRSRTA